MMTTDHLFENTCLTPLMSTNIRSSEFQEALIRMLDQADLWRRCVRRLRRLRFLQAMLPRSHILGDGVLGADSKFASGGSVSAWKGFHGRSSARIVKTFHAYPRGNPSMIKQRLLQEIVIWRRLSHPDVLPVFCIPPKLFSSCVGSEWVIDGNIVEFTSSHPEANRLRLLAEAASGLQYLHSMGIIHSDLNPMSIVVDSNPHPHPSNHGLVGIMSDPNTVDLSNTMFPSADTLRYMAPELICPGLYDLEDSNPTKKSDIYAFGVVAYQVVTGEQPFPGTWGFLVARDIITGVRPSRPPGPNEWVSVDVWNLLCKCWSLPDDRPDIDFVMNTLNDAADAIEAVRRKSYVTNRHGKRTYRSGSASSEPPGDRVGDASIQERFQSPLPPPQVPTTPSPFVAMTRTDSEEKQGKEKKRKKEDFRTWHDSSGLHRQHAALVYHKAGVIHLSSPDGTLVEVLREKLAKDDLDYLRARDMYKRAWRKVASYLP